MTQPTHKEQTRGWALVAQQLAVAIHLRQEAVQPVVEAGPVRWYPRAVVSPQRQRELCDAGSC
jgi:hypothetical protein